MNRRAVSLWPALRQARIDDDQADSIMTSVIDAFEPDGVYAGIDADMVALTN